MTIIMKTFIILAVFFCRTLYSQIDMQKENDTQKEIESVKQADIDFSNLSNQTDMRQAFLEFSDNYAVLQRPYNRTIKGFDAVKKELGDEPVEFTLTWAPLYGDVSLAGELGYTYGTFELTSKNEKGESETRKGTYVTVWKKNSE